MLVYSLLLLRFSLGSLKATRGGSQRTGQEGRLWEEVGQAGVCVCVCACVWREEFDVSLSHVHTVIPIQIYPSLAVTANQRPSAHWSERRCVCVRMCISACVCVCVCSLAGPDPFPASIFSL